VERLSTTLDVLAFALLASSAGFVISLPLGEALTVRTSKVVALGQPGENSGVREISCAVQPYQARDGVAKHAPHLQTTARIDTVATTLRQLP
jgi:hypothetical protein